MKPSPNFTLFGSLTIAMAVIVIITIIFTVQQNSAANNIQIKIGPKGDIGDTGPPGDCNLTSFNGTFLASILEISDYIFFQENASIILHPTNPITVFDSNNSLLLGTILFNEMDGCFSMEPSICVSSITGTINTTILNISGYFLQILNNLVIDSLFFGNQSFIKLTELIPGNASSTVLEFSNNIPIYIPNLALPLFIGSNYLTTGNGTDYLIIHSDYIIDVQTPVIFLKNSTFFLDGSGIISNLSFTGFLNYKQNSGFTLPSGGYVSELNGTCGNNSFIINGLNSPLQLSSLNGICLSAPSTNFFTNLSIYGNINTPLYLTSQIFFSDNTTSIYNQGGCLTLEANQICLIANTTFNFSTPVTFNKPIKGSPTFEGNVTIEGSLFINGSFSLINLTIQDTLRSNKIITNRSTINLLESFESGSQLLLKAGSSFASLSGSLVLMSPDSLVFASTNASSVSCSSTYFDVASGCIPRCTNHSICTDTYASLSVTNDLRVLGEIYTTSYLNPHPCCTGMSPTNFLYSSYSGTMGTLYNTSSVDDDDWKQIPLNFTTNNYPTLGNVLNYLTFYGGSNITFNNTGQYTIDVSAQIEKSSSAKQVMFILLCAPNTDAITSPIFRTFNGFNFGGLSIQRISTTWVLKMTAGNTCTISLAFSNGYLTIQSGRVNTIGIHVNNVLF